MNVPPSVLLDTGCVPDWTYAMALLTLGFVGWRAWRARTRQSAG